MLLHTRKWVLIMDCKEKLDDAEILSKERGTMKTTPQDALNWINEQDTKFARTSREKAKYLVAATLPHNLPHPSLWWEVLKLSKGL